MKYSEFKITLLFREPMEFYERPLYLMRSLMGMSLHALCCSKKDTVCCKCNLCSDCLYSKIFEGFYCKPDTVNFRPIHPFSIHLLDRISGSSVESYSFIVKIYGETVKNIPYVVASFMRSGEIGAGKNKIKYDVEITDVDGSEFLCDATKNWEELLDAYKPYRGKILVKAITPLRFKTDGKYCLDFSVEQFMLALRRRYISIVDTFGAEKAIREMVSPDNEIVNRKLRWNEANHWSSRQQNRIQIGGAVGSFIMSGNFTSYEMMLMDFASKFSAGKNVSFGLGNIEFWRDL